MTGMHATYRFADGRLAKTSAPAWFTNAIANSQNWDESFQAAGAGKIDEFVGGNHAIEVYQASDETYFVLYWEYQNCIADIFIDNIADYLLFRAVYVAPLVMLINAGAPAQSQSGGGGESGSAGSSGGLWSRIRGG